MVRGFLPYGWWSDTLRALWISGVPLDRLTILLGPNASGKTSVLEAIGYTLAPALPAALASSSILLVATLRPRGVPPRLAAGALRLSGGELLETLHLDLIHLSVYHRYPRLQEHIERISPEIGKSVAALSLEHEKIIDVVQWRITHGTMDERRQALRAFIEALLEGEIEASIASVHRRVRVEEGLYPEVLEKFGPFIGARVFIAFARLAGKLRKSIILAKRGTVAFFAEKGSWELPSVIVMHPGFVFIPGLFERLYEQRVREHLPGEKRALEMLARYIPGVEGFEIIFDTLVIRVGNRRVSVYELSDGQRMAVFIALLYALARPPSLALIDTPEAFLHPDGLPVAAGLIAELVATGNQVVLATQSIELLQELLRECEARGMLADVHVHRLRVVNGEVRVAGSWSGSTSLYALQELAVDLRR